MPDIGKNCSHKIELFIGVTVNDTGGEVVSIRGLW